jgi:hypothetical protein
MVNNSTNINKRNNLLSPKENLDSDGQQFYQYQQTEQPPLTQRKLRQWRSTARLVTLVFISDTMLPYKNKLKCSTMTFWKTKNQKSWNIKTVNIFPIALFCMYCRWRFSFQEERIGNSLKRLIKCVTVPSHGRIFGFCLCLNTWDKRWLFVSLISLDISRFLVFGFPKCHCTAF